MKLCVMQCLQLIFNKLSKFIIDSPLQNRTIEDKKPLWVSCNNCGKRVVNQIDSQCHLFTAQTRMISRLFL